MWRRWPSRPPGQPAPTTPTPASSPTSPNGSPCATRRWRASTARPVPGVGHPRPGRRATGDSRPRPGTSPPRSTAPRQLAVAIARAAARLPMEPVRLAEVEPGQLVALRSPSRTRSWSRSTRRSRCSWRRPRRCAAPRGWPSPRRYLDLFRRRRPPSPRARARRSNRRSRTRGRHRGNRHRRRRDAEAFLPDSFRGHLQAGGYEHVRGLGLAEQAEQSARRPSSCCGPRTAPARSPRWSSTQPGHPPGPRVRRTSRRSSTGCWGWRRPTPGRHSSAWTTAGSSATAATCCHDRRRCHARPAASARSHFDDEGVPAAAGAADRARDPPTR